MKTRLGFVSNSSSSSFVIRRAVAKYAENGKFKGWVSCLTKEQEKKLKKFGFFKTWAHSPCHIPEDYEERQEHIKRTAEATKVHRDNNFNFGYYLECNQDEVIAFLLENQIPFVADEHYEMYSLVYDAETGKVTRAVNFGKIMSVYGVNDVKDTTNAVQTFTRKQYLKRVK